MADKKVYLKVLVDSKRNKVVFAEADSETTDVIFSFLTQPLGTIIRQLKNHCAGEKRALGCFNNLYESVSNLSTSSFWTEERKRMLLRPRNAYEIHYRNLKLKIDDSQPINYYRCINNIVDESDPDRRGTCKETNTNLYAKCSCGRSMYVICGLSNYLSRFNGGGEVFTYANRSFIITDDLCVMPSSVKSDIATLKNLLEGVDATDVQTVSVGFKEIMHLLNFSLLSRTTLTSFLNYQLKSGDTIVEPDHADLPADCKTTENPKDPLKTVLKALMHKPTNKLLFFVAGIDFIEFLFTLLTIPLAKIISLLNGKTNIGSIDNLYCSIHKCTRPAVYRQLAYPDLPENYISKKYKHFFPLYEAYNPTHLKLNNPEGERGYVKAPEMFMLTDDLKVTPLSSISIIEYLSTHNLHLSDVEELQLEIGTKEALDILRVSLTSSHSALSIALQLFIGKQPKKE